MYVKIESPNSLGGWFGGFCPSNGIADRLNKQSAGVRAQKLEYDKKLNALKNGEQAAEWENLKKQVKKLDDELKDLNRNLEKERAIASAIGATSGLGAWCNGAVSRRKKAEASLRDAEKALGIVKGALDILQKQQTQGIKEAGAVIKENQQKIEAVKQEIRKVQTSIEVYKAKRDNERKELAQNAEAKKAAGKSDIMGKIKENAPLIIAGTVVVAAAAIYLKKGKKTKKSTPKAVEA
ncbi:hypothetical protein V2647_06825 [Tenacibaculum maritimum]|uniref:hypothetical protein n=1 Tax=Tenacibaculum maritimum TaxID=107401 RepID=UPI0038776492